MISDGIVAKIRSDAICSKDLFSVYKKTKSARLPLRNKIFISNVKSCVPDFRRFSPSDWIYVGEQQDVKERFNIKTNSQAVAKYVDCCEQVFCVSNLIKSHVVDLKNIINETDENKALNLQFFKENFVFVGTRSGFGAIMSRYPKHLDNDKRFMTSE